MSIATDVIALILVAFIVVIGLLFYTFFALGKGWSLHSLCHDFKRKIYMTLSLGALFFLFYIACLAIAAYVSKHWGADLIFLLHHRSVESIYWGLCLFASFSLTTYLIRMVVKYFYLTRGNDK